MELDTGESGNMLSTNARPDRRPPVAAGATCPGKHSQPEPGAERSSISSEKRQENRLANQNLELDDHATGPRRENAVFSLDGKRGYVRLRRHFRVWDAETGKEVAVGPKPANGIAFCATAGIAAAVPTANFSSGTPIRATNSSRSKPVKAASMRHSLPMDNSSPP